MKKITAIIFIFFVPLTLNFCSPGNKKITLRFKYNPGLNLTYKQLSKRSVKISKGDSIIKEGTHSYTMKIQQEVKRFVDDSTAEVLEQDSWQTFGPNKEDSSLIDTIQNTRKLILQVLPNGKVINFKFVNDDDITLANYIKNYYEQGLPVFPVGEKSPGYSWTQSTRIMLPNNNIEASTTYIIKSLVREAGYDCAVIEYKGNMLIPIESDPNDSTHRSGIDRIKTNGLLYFAYKEGIVISQREHWIIDGDRSKILNGKKEHYKLAMNYDIDYMLIKKEQI